MTTIIESTDDRKIIGTMLAANKSKEYSKVTLHRRGQLCRLHLTLKNNG